MRAQEYHLLQLLSNHDVTFFIPPYQRNYEWDIEQCKVFYQDIKKTTLANLDNKKVEHFFGTIVYVQDEAVFGQPDKLILTDGQQRITTTMLFLMAIRDVINDEKYKHMIDNKYLKNNNTTEETGYKIKLKQVETDWEVYRNLILGLELNQNDIKSDIYKNYKYFLDRLSVLKKSNELRLERLISHGIDKFSIVTIQLEPVKNSWENPQEIFESMNSLGKPLSLADLVRNYLLLGKDASEQENLYRNYWLAMEKMLPGKISDFIRDYMQYEAAKDYKKATARNYKELYSNFKSLFGNKETYALLNRLKSFAKYYSYIVLGASSGNNLIDQKLADLRSISVTITYSFLLCIFYSRENKHLLDNEVGDIIDALIVYFLRRRILKLTQGENKNFPPLVSNIKQLENANNKKIAMFEILANQENSFRLPNDTEVGNVLRDMDFYNFRQNKFVLSLIEEYISKSRPDKTDKNLQIEHIMPQTLNNAWKNELGNEFEQVHQEFINNVGNLTLIRHNQELGNKKFDEKKKIYDNKAGLQIAQNEITNRSKWNKNSIQNRNRWITTLILEKVLTIPKNMRHKNNWRVNRLTFTELQMIGKNIQYASNNNIQATIINDHEVLFEGKHWKLTPLTREIETRRGTQNESGSYNGFRYWKYQGRRLADIM